MDFLKFTKYVYDDQYFPNRIIKYDDKTGTQLRTALTFFDNIIFIALLSVL